MHAAALPARCGVGLKPRHVEDVLRGAPALGFFEVHAENYMVAGGPLHRQLTAVRERYPLSLHGVALGIGGEAPLEAAHLRRLRALVERYQPAAFSEHLAWSGHGGVFLNDLLPLPYDRTSLERVCAHVQQAQDQLGLRLLLENPSTYFEFEASTMSEAAFLGEVVRRTGCGLLLDLNNVHVSCVNRADDAAAYLEALPLHAVGEIHLAGFARDTGDAGAPLLIDDHGSAVDAAVWELYESVSYRLGPLPTLIEWDNAVPAFGELLAQARKAQKILDRREAFA
jgi:uncharacterized protein (UPF0276 family)